MLRNNRRSVKQKQVVEPEAFSTETAAWLLTLYGRCTDDDGQVAIIASNKKKLVGTCPIGSPAAIRRLTRQLSGQRGLYFKVNLVDGDAIYSRSKATGKGRFIVGNAAEVKTIVAFALDVDAGKAGYASRATALAALDAMPHKPTMIVNSNGDAGGFHAYWTLRQPHRIQGVADRQRIIDAARRWQTRLGELIRNIEPEAMPLDHTADITRMLRVVGQQRQDSGMVCCHDCDLQREYTMEELTIPLDRQQVREEAYRKAKQWVRQLLSQPDLSNAKRTGKPISDYIDAAGITPETLLADAGYVSLGDGAYRRPGSESGGRSLLLATKHERAGVNVFSSADPLFCCDDRQRGTGTFHSVDEMFVAIRFAGDWQAAASRCGADLRRSQMEVSA